MFVTEARAFPGIAVSTITTSAHAGMVKVHIVPFMVGSLVAFVANHTGLILEKKTSKCVMSACPM